MFTRSLTFSLKEPDTFHISDFTFIFKLNDAMQALCDTAFRTIVTAPLLKNLAFKIVDELSAQNLFEHQNIRVSSQISNDIFDMVRNDPLLQTLIEHLDLSTAQNIVPLISLSTSTHPLSIVFSLHV